MTTITRLFLAGLLSLVLASISALPARATLADAELTVRYVTSKNIVRGTASGVGGEWYLTLEQRKKKTDAWTALAGGPQRGREKAVVINSVSGPGYNYEGQWRTCATKHRSIPREKKVCSKAITVAVE